MTPSARKIYRKLRKGKRVMVRSDSGIEFEFVPETFDMYPRYSVHRLGGCLHRYIMLTEREAALTFERFTVIKRKKAQHALVK